MTAEDILRDAAQKHDPVAVFAGFSGGHDSLVSTHWTMTRGARVLQDVCPDVPLRVLHINTGIGIEQTREFVRETCTSYDWPLWERHAAEGEFEQFVQTHGFPGPGQHHRMYQRLKERVVRGVLREVKTHRMQRVMFVTGIYGAESTIRMSYRRAVSKVDAQVWVNPLYWQPHAYFRKYRRTHDLPENPVKIRYGHSGECLCGAYADGAERALLRRHFPEVEQRLQELEALAAATGHHWRWHEGPADFQDPNQIRMFAPMCHGCGKNADMHALEGDPNA